MKYIKVYKNLEPGRYFTTVWCTLDEKARKYLHKKLRRFSPYTKWLSTFGDAEMDPKYQPHISLRYLGYTDELNVESLEKDKKLFEKAIKNVKHKIEVGEFKVWERHEDGKLLSARIFWNILNNRVLRDIHSKLLEIPGYYMFSELEGSNYTSHISLGEINLANNNYDKVKDIINTMNFEKITFGFQNFAINIPSEKGRREIYLSSS